MQCLHFHLSEKFSISEFTHSTRLSSPIGWDVSTGFRPVISSKSTTPNENTSDFSVNLPLYAYSGAIYLNNHPVEEFRYKSFLNKTLCFEKLELLKRENTSIKHTQASKDTKCLPESPHNTCCYMCICIKS